MCPKRAGLTLDDTSKMIKFAKICENLHFCANRPHVEAHAHCWGGIFAKVARFMRSSFDPAARRHMRFCISSAGELSETHKHAAGQNARLRAPIAFSTRLMSR
jgi:hypothetical protein